MSRANNRSAEGSGGIDPAWQNAYVRARDLVSQMTIDEKVNMTNGHKGTCVGNTPSIERLGIPPLWCVATITGTTMVTAANKSPASPMDLPELEVKSLFPRSQRKWSLVLRSTVLLYAASAMPWAWNTTRRA
jgi:hypothetical protein